MDNNTFYTKLQEMLELNHSVNGSTALNDLAEWDSIAVISFIALADAEYAATVPPQRIAQCSTVDDLASLIDEFSARPAE